MNYTDARDLVRAHADALLDDTSLHVHAVGVGHPDRGRVGTSETWCVVVHVHEDAVEDHALDEYVEHIHALLTELAGQTLEVRVRAERQRAPRASIEDIGLTTPNPRQRVRPFSCGLSISNVACPSYDAGKYLAGTLGFFTSKGSDTFLVTNNHVIAGENAADVGDAIVQQGTLDMSSSERELLNTSAKVVDHMGIGTLSGFVPLKFASDERNRVDLAWAKVSGEAGTDYTPAKVYHAGSIAGVAAALTDDSGSITGETNVYKMGRTTGLTTGVIDAIHVSVNVSYGSRTGRFVEQYSIEGDSSLFGASGDSGSAILNTQHELTALLFACGSSKTYANPIHDVLPNLPDGMTVIVDDSKSAVDAADTGGSDETSAKGPSAQVVFHFVADLDTGDVAPFSVAMFQDDGQILSAQSVSNITNEPTVTVPVPLTLSLTATDQKTTVTYETPSTGISYRCVRDEDGALAFEISGDSTLPEIAVANRMSVGSLDIALLRGSVPSVVKTDVVPYQMATFVDVDRVGFAVFMGDEHAVGDTPDLSKLASEVFPLVPGRDHVYTIRVNYSSERAQNGDPPFILELENIGYSA